MSYVQSIKTKEDSDTLSNPPSPPELGIPPRVLTLSGIEPLIINIWQKITEEELKNIIPKGALTETVVQTRGLRSVLSGTSHDKILPLRKMGEDPPRFQISLSLSSPLPS